MAKKLKTKLKKNLLALVLLLSIGTKILEWLGQYIASKVFNISLSEILFPKIMIIQIFFILVIASILYYGFNYMKVKSKTYLLIPVLAYFIKEVFNFIFIYGRIVNLITIIALIVEPLLLYIMVMKLNKYWLKLK